MRLNSHTQKAHSQSGCLAAGAFKSRGSILKDANTSGGRAEAHRGGDYSRAKNSIGLFYGASVRDTSLMMFHFVCMYEYWYILQECTLLCSTVNQGKSQRSRHHNLASKSLPACQSCWNDSTIWTKMIVIADMCMHAQKKKKKKNADMLF